MFKKKLLIVFLFVLMLTSAIPLSAAATEQDGIIFTLTTDKDEYDATEEITVSVEVENTNDFSVSDVKIDMESVLPEGYEIKSITKNGAATDGTVSELAAKASVTFEATLVPVDVKPETYTYLGPDNAWKSKRFADKDAKSIYTANVENTITLLENSRRVFVNGEKKEMEAKAIWKDEKLYMPKSAFTDVLGLSASVRSITEGGIKYVPAAEALKAAGKDVYEYKRFVIAGQDVSAFREDFLATEYAAYVNGYVDITEMTWTQDDFDGIIERVEYNLVCDEKLLSEDDERVQSYIVSLDATAKGLIDKYHAGTLYSGFSAATPATTGVNIYTDVLNITKAWATPGSEFYHDEDTLDVIIGALDWLYDNCFGSEVVENVPIQKPNADVRYLNDNWYPWQISIPQYLSHILVLIRDELSFVEMARYIEPMQHTISTPHGRAANVAMISYNCIVYGALLGDPVPIVDGRNCLAYELAYKFQEVVTQGSLQNGIYADGSYLDHSGSPYMFGYGVSFCGTIYDGMSILKDTAFEIIDVDTPNTSEWIIENVFKYMYKDIGSSSLGGRNASGDYEAGLNAINTAIRALPLATEADALKIKQLIKYTAENSTIGIDYYYKKMGLGAALTLQEIMEDTSIKAVGHGEFTEFAYNQEIQSTQREDWGYILALSSKRIKRWEAFTGHSEQTGLDYWHLHEGATHFYVDNADGTVSYNTKAGWWAVGTADKSKVPGTTVDSTERVLEGYRDLYDVQHGDNDFSGGVEFAQKYGTAAMQFYGFNYDGSKALESGGVLQGATAYESTLEAKKAYFTFRDALVMLGADINSTDDKEVWTVLDNRLLTGQELADVPENEGKVATLLEVTNVVASADDGNVVENMLDGDFNTRWSAAGEVWTVLDLGEPKDVAGLRAIFHKSAYTRKAKFDIYVSSDNENWRPVITDGESAGGPQFEYEAIVFDEVQENVRYIKYVGHGNTLTTVDSKWNSVVELEVHGPDAEGKFNPTEFVWQYGLEKLYVDGTLKSGLEYEDMLAEVSYLNFNDRLGYVLLEELPVTVSKTNDRNGSFVKYYMHHGTNPTDDTYAYVVLPGATDAETKAYAENPGVVVLRNDELVQAVYEPASNMTGYVFWEAAEEGDIKAGQACIIMTDVEGAAMTLSMAEPTRLSDVLDVTLAGEWEVVGAPYYMTVTVEGDVTNIHVALPGDDNGETHTIELRNKALVMRTRIIVGVILGIVILAAVVILAYFYRKYSKNGKNSKKILSILLCLAMLGAMLSANVLQVEATAAALTKTLTTTPDSTALPTFEIAKSVTASKYIAVGRKLVKIQCLVEYTMEEEFNPVTFAPSVLVSGDDKETFWTLGMEAIEPSAPISASNGFVAPTYCGKWTNTNDPDNRLEFKFTEPTDITPYVTMELDMYISALDATKGEEIYLVVQSPDGTDGLKNFYYMPLNLYWKTGWNHFSIILDEASFANKVGSPDFSNVEMIYLAGEDGFLANGTDSGNEEISVCIGKIFLKEAVETPEYTPSPMPVGSKALTNLHIAGGVALRWTDASAATSNKKLGYWSDMVNRLYFMNAGLDFENAVQSGSKYYYNVKKEYSSLVFDMYLPEAYSDINNKTQLIIVFQSLNNEAARKSIKLDWTGWKTIEIPFDNENLAYSAGELIVLSHIHLNIKGMGSLYGDPDAQAFIGQVYLKPKTAN